MIRKASFVFACATGLALVLSTQAAAATVPVLVSNEPSPYASCSTPSGGGTNYVSAEVEPTAASNPATPGNLIALWHQDRWSNGGAHGIGAGFSTNNGATWDNVILPFSQCASGGLPFERASDPWVSFGPDGTAYVSALCFNIGVNFDSGVCAASSSTGGASWQNVQVIELDKTKRGSELNDKNSTTADPVKAGTAYTVYDDVSGPLPSPQGLPHVLGFQGDAIFQKTTDGGKTWSNTKIIVHTGNYTQTIGNIIVVDPNSGTLYDFFDLILGTNHVGRNHGKFPTGPSPFNVAFVKSTDGGNSWSSPQIIANEQTVGVPNTRTGDILPEPAIDPATGQLYVVWQDSRFNGFNYDEVALATSTDGGQTWTMRPTPVNDDNGQPAFTPMVTINSNGAVGVTYYQFESPAPGLPPTCTGFSPTSCPTDYFSKTSSTHGATFGSANKITGPFNMATAPKAGGFFVGDYEALVANEKEFHAVFGATTGMTTTNRTDIFSSQF